MTKTGAPTAHNGLGDVSQHDNARLPDAKSGMVLGSAKTVAGTPSLFPSNTRQEDGTNTSCECKIAFANMEASQD